MTLDKMKDTKIYLVTVIEENYRGKSECIVSYGIGNNTLKNHVLSCDPVNEYSYKIDDYGRYLEV